MDYIDVCELIKETENDIARLKKKRKIISSDNVKGSNLDFPYQEQHFKIEGTTFTDKDDLKLRREEKILNERKLNAEKIKSDVEEWMNTVPVRMQRIIRYKFFEGLSWEQTAVKIKKNISGEKLRKEFERFIKNF